jgi:hypothetical protein
MGKSSVSSAGGIKLSVNKGAIEIGVKHIDSMLTDNPELFKRLQEVIRQDVWAARNSVVRNMQSIFANGDHAQARRAVRNIIYQKVLGANLNIREMKKGTSQWKVTYPDRKVRLNPHMRGGNRIQRTEETAKRQGYEGKARGMILRWVDDGTGKRKTRYGNRGAITARNFFEPMASSALDVVSQHMAQIIEEEIAKMFNENNNE